MIKTKYGVFLVEAADQGERITTPTLCVIPDSDPEQRALFADQATAAFVSEAMRLRFPTATYEVWEVTRLF